MKTLLIILLFFSLSLRATTYYVATNGSDSNNGSSGSEWLTLQHAADNISAGDIVIVRDGTYVSTADMMVVLYSGGNGESPVIFRSEHKYGAVLNGDNVSDFCFSLWYGVSYLKFLDFEIRNFLWAGFDINHSGYTNSYIEISGCKIHDIGRVADNGDYGRDGIYITHGCSYINIARNLFYNIGRTSSDNYMNKDHAIYTGEITGGVYAHHISIVYNVIYNCSGVGITTGSNDDLIANNIVAWSNYNAFGGSASLAIDLSVTGLTLANNIFLLDSNDESFAIWTEANPTYSGWSIKNNIVYGARMNCYTNAGTIAAMDGGNYGQTDCENSEVDPLLVSAIRGSTPDFHLTANSVAINSGADVGLTYDYVGRSLIGLPDIGAYEYGIKVYVKNRKVVVKNGKALY
jgi:hypothetical protein